MTNVIKIADHLDKLTPMFEGRTGAIPVSADATTTLIKDEDLPWIDDGQGTLIQLLQVDLAQGLWVVKNKMAPGTKVMTHFHTGTVFAVTQKGNWFYSEYPDEVNAPGDYLFEPAGSVHTLCIPEDQDGDTEIWFAIYGTNINIDADGNVVSIVDAKAILDLYRNTCDAAGQSYDKLIVIGEGV